MQGEYRGLKDWLIVDDFVIVTFYKYKLQNILQFVFVLMDVEKQRNLIISSQVISTEK